MEEYVFQSDFNSSLAILERLHQSFNTAIVYISQHKISACYEILHIIYDDLYAYLKPEERQTIESQLLELGMIISATKKKTHKHNQELRQACLNKTHRALRTLRDVQEKHDLGMRRKQDAGMAMSRGRF